MPAPRRRPPQYDDVRDMTEGILERDHPKIRVELLRWPAMDREDPLVWARYQHGARMR